MIVSANNTRLEGVVTRITPAADGDGIVATFTVSQNLSAPETKDFLKSKPGDTIEIFTLQPSHGLHKDEKAVIDVRLNAGPFGSRVILGKVVRP